MTNERTNKQFQKFLNKISGRGRGRGSIFGNNSIINGGILIEIMELHNENLTNKMKSVSFLIFFVCFCLCFVYGWNFTETHNFTLQHCRESFALCIIALLCGTYQPRLCVLELLPNEFTGGISDDPTTPTHLRINNTATHFTYDVNYFCQYCMRCDA